MAIPLLVPKDANLNLEYLIPYSSISLRSLDEEIALYFKNHAVL
jgi:hypothetical protein